MVKFISVALVLIGAVYFFTQDAFKRDLSYGGKTFEFFQSHKRGDVKTYFYKLSGHDGVERSNIVQLIKLDSTIPEAEYATRMDNVFKSLGINKIGSDPFEAAGYKKIREFYHSIYSSSIYVNNEKVVVLYQEVSSEDTQGPSRDIYAVIGDLREIHFTD